MLKFSKANAKIEALKTVEELQPYLDGGKRKIYSLDLLSGHSCPFAHDCLSKAVADENGKRTIKDGPHTQFRCFSASQEVQYTNVYNLRQHNYDALKAHKDDADMMYFRLYESIPSDTGIVRIHVAGDFFNENYFKAWIRLANKYAGILFYAYTKSLRYWANNRDDVPDNLVLTASYGGRDDNMIDTHSLRSAKVIFSEADANGLEIDHDDSHAARPSLAHKDFALLIHGTQPKGTEAAQALKTLKGKGSYSRKKKPELTYGEIMV